MEPRLTNERGRERRNKNLNRNIFCNADWRHWQCLIFYCRFYCFSKMKIFLLKNKNSRGVMSAEIILKLSEGEKKMKKSSHTSEINLSMSFCFATSMTLRFIFFYSFLCETTFIIFEMRIENRRRWRGWWRMTTEEQQKRESEEQGMFIYGVEGSFHAQKKERTPWSRMLCEYFIPIMAYASRTDERCEV